MARKNEWSEVETFEPEFRGGPWVTKVLHRSRLVDTYYGPELEVEFWREDEPDHIMSSQECGSATWQICTYLNSLDDDDDDRWGP